MSAFLLKVIALFTMAVDHVGAVFFPDHLWIRYIGRISFPIFAFLLTEGFIHSSNRRKYLGRILLFAFLSEIPYDLCLFDVAFDWNHQNIFFELGAGLLLLSCLEKLEAGRYAWALLPPVIAVAAGWAGFSYGVYGLAMMAGFYLLRNKPAARAAWCGVISFVMQGIATLRFPLLGREVVLLSENFTQLYAVGASLPLFFYNGRKGPGSLKWAFYLFYPLHLLLLWGISLALA